MAREVLRRKKRTSDAREPPERSGAQGHRERRCWGVRGAKPLGLMSDGERSAAKKEANERRERATGAERGAGAPRATVLGSPRGEAPRINERWREKCCEERSERATRESHRSGAGRRGTASDGVGESEGRSPSD